MLITSEQLKAFMLLSPEQLKTIVPLIGKRSDIFIIPLNDALQKYEINTTARIAAFIAQIAHESGSFHYVEEIASGKKYTHRSDLGNTDPVAIKAAEPYDTGPFYKGRGLIQITGYFNYKRCGEALGVDLVHYPAMLSSVELACRSAAWYWHDHGLNELADNGNFELITRRINGGLNGYQDRLYFYHRALEVLHV